MMKHITHAGLAITVFLVIAGGLVWATGTLGALTGVTAEAGQTGHEGDDHGANSAAPAGGDACCPGEKSGDDNDETAHKELDGDGHAHGEGPAVNLDPNEIEKARCEHDMPMIDCDECRYELGVVKLQPGIAAALTKTAIVREGEMAAVLRLTGEVRYDGTRVVDVTPIASGKVVAVKARLGQKVSAGDVLAVIHSGDFGEAKATYMEAVAAADIAGKEKDRYATVSSALEKLLASLKNGQASANGSGSPLGEWKSKLIGASARLQQAKAVHEREQSLVAKRASSKAELETAQRELRTAQANYAGMVEEVNLNLNLDRLKSESAARLADARMNAARQRLNIFGLDADGIQAVTNGKENGSFAQLDIKAPRDGTITALNITEGKVVETTQTMFTVADTSNMWVWCDLYERDLGVLHEYLSNGKTAKALVKVAAFKDPVAGTVDLIGSEVNRATRTVKVRVQVRNERGRLKPGMFATVTVELPASAKTAIVPRSAVLSDEGCNFAFQHFRDDLWLRRNVVVGKTRDDMVEIASGLTPGATVVCKGGFLFKSDVLREKMGAGCAD